MLVVIELVLFCLSSSEYEKQDELKRSAMRALCALINIADADKNIVVNEFVAQIRANSEMAQVRAITREGGACSMYTHLIHSVNWAEYLR